MDWTPDQQRALKALEGSGNVFVTGGAGTGKSTVVQEFIKNKIQKTDKAAVLASTGTAAILLGGRTFHSFFGLGIMEGGLEKTVERVTHHKGIVQRLKKIDLILIDEVSMLGATELTAADQIARKARKLDAPWGGMRVVMVGDFAQLPPIQNFSGQSRSGEERPERPWCFNSEIWQKSELEGVNLSQIVRSRDASWNQILAEVRWAELSEYAVEVLQSRMKTVAAEFEGTRLFARRAQVEALNHDRLEKLPSKVREYNTVYMGVAAKVDELKRNAPIPEVLYLKEGAFVMFRQNDPEFRFVNGTLGFVSKLEDHLVTVELLIGGKTIELKKSSFSVLDAEGEPVATATNFPLNLAWACTIHKAQGATLDKVHANLKGVWEHGQSYVALSRVRALTDLTIEGLSPRVFLADPAVREFYDRLNRG
ncbi:MAG: AAA family ATPase [Bdellovibrionales bacterium]|nr:AAA family ATPase [Bdellovibrionales bacterium]